MVKEKFYTCKYDKAFKEIMMKEENFEILKKVLESILEVTIEKIELQPLHIPTGNIHLKGKEVVFHVTLNEIKSRILPDIDEDFFKDLGYDKVTNEDELKSEVEKVISERKEADRDDRFIEEVLKTASENMEVEIPAEIIDDEIHRMMEQFESQLKMQNLTLEQYMNFSGMTHEDFHKNMEPEATKRVKYRYLLEAVAEEEKIEVTEEDAMKDAEEMAKNYGKEDDKEFLKNENVRNYIKQGIESEKAIDFLVENAKIK